MKCSAAPNVVVTFIDDIQCPHGRPVLLSFIYTLSYVPFVLIQYFTVFFIAVLSNAEYMIPLLMYLALKTNPTSGLCEESPDDHHQTRNPPDAI